MADQGEFIGKIPPKTPLPRSTINLKYTSNDLQVPGKVNKNLKDIGLVPKQIVTKLLISKPKIENGMLVSDLERDNLKLVVVERHHATGNVGVGFVRGFNLKEGALGSTVAHDAHNVVIVGTNDADILLAIKELEHMQGGQVAVANGKIKAALPLPIAGLVSDKSVAEVTKQLANLNGAAKDIGCLLDAPFMSLSFLSLSPIPGA